MRRLLWTGIPRGLRWGVLFGVLPLLALAGLVKWGIAPWIVRRHISSWFAEHSNGRLEIRWASVGFHEIRLYGVSLTDRAGNVHGKAASVIVHIDRPIVGFGSPIIQSLRVVRPDVSVTIDPDGHPDIQKILKRPPQEPVPVADPPPKPGSTPAPSRMPPAFDVEGGTLRFNSPFLTTTFGTIDAKILVLPDRYEWTAVQGESMGGRASLSGFVGRNGGEGWSVQINVQDASVHEMTLGTALESRDLGGRLNAFLSLGSAGGPDPHAVGAGWIDIDQGKLLDLPVLLSVFNVLRLRAPGDSSVRECRTDFRVLSDRLHFDRFYIMTDGICLFGDGDVTLADHSLDLNFIPALIGELPPGVEDARKTIQPATDFISKHFLLNVEVKGTWTAPDAHPLPISVLSRPLTDIVKWVVGERKKK